MVFFKNLQNGLVVAGRSNYNWFFDVLLTSITASLTIYLTGWNNLIEMTDKINLISNDPGDIFDFIVVGSGSAGGIVANRLSEKYRVLLLEAGGDPHPLQTFPSFALPMVNRPETDWIHRTTPQKYSSLAMYNRQSVWNQGRSLGGSSNINFMTQNRGSPRDFDNWALITGDDSWSYENVLPFFKKHEDFSGHWPAGDVHGTGGEIRIELPHYTEFSELGRNFIEAGQELGYKHTDLNGRYSEGFDLIYASMKGGRRHQTYAAFIKPILKRTNLIIRRFAHVNKVLFRGKRNDAFAVEYDQYGTRKLAYATKEIILSAGAIKSPQILMLSGIGPKNTLESLGIPVKKDLPGVGRNLQDHLCTYLGPFFINKPISFLADRDLTAKSAIEFLTQGTGTFTNVAATAQAFISSEVKYKNDKSAWPDLQLYFVPLGIDKQFAESMSHAFNLRRDISQAYFGKSVGRDAFMIFVSNARPKARGEITLLSSDPYSPPTIEPNYLDNDSDLQVTVAGVKKAVYLAENTTVFKNIGARFADDPFPGCENVTFRSHEYWECYIRQFTVTVHHHVGTCSMGRPESPNSVVDTKFRVIGTNRLRVIDASIIPVLTVGNINAPTMMIGEKGSHVILAHWDNHPDESTNTISPNWPPSFIDSNRKPFRGYDNEVIRYLVPPAPFVDKSNNLFK